MEKRRSLDILEKQIHQGKKAGLLGALQIGMALEEINSGNLFLEARCKTISEYASKSHGIGRSTTFNLMAVATKFGRLILDDPSLQSIEPTRLIRLLPFVDDSNQLDLLHTAAQVPGAQAWDDTLRNLAGKTGSDDPHTHSWEPINLLQCSVCGLRKKGEK